MLLEWGVALLSQASPINEIPKRSGFVPDCVRFCQVLSKHRLRDRAKKLVVRKNSVHRDLHPSKRALSEPYNAMTGLLGLC